MDTLTSKDFLSIEELARAHEKALQMAVDLFECLQEGNDAISRKVLDNLKCDIAYQRIHYAQSNNMKSRGAKLGERLRKFARK